MDAAYSGLSSQEALQRLHKHGPNDIEKNKSGTALKLFLRQFKNNFILYLLFAAAGISFFVGEHITTSVILLVCVMVVTISFIQEYRAEKAIESLKGLMTFNSIVIRDGHEKHIASRDLVPGDILILRTGERVPADCVVLSESRLRIDESILTGESKEVKKVATQNAETISGDHMLFMGSFIVNGKCTAYVTHTGMNTKFGEIVRMIADTEKELPLQGKVNRIARSMVIVALITSVLTGALMLYRSSGPLSFEGFSGILILVISLSVSAFPEGLPVVLMTTLALGARRMARKNAIVNRISIIETLGETTIICSDKTGTITTGEMTVRKIYTNDDIVDVEGSGYSSVGGFSKKGEKINSEHDEHLKLLMTASVMCNDARVEEIKDASYKLLGTPTEGALLVMAGKAQIFREDIEYKQLEEIPFDSKRKMMSVLCSGMGKTMVFAKGAPEFLLEKCTHVERNGIVTPLTLEERNKILAITSNFTKDALRVLALAYKKVEVKTLDEEQLVFLGVVGMDDPPREGIKEALSACKTAGIAVKMITGDNKETATAIAREIGLTGEVVEGDYLNSLSDEELVELLPRVGVFARVKPEHKMRIVRVLKSMGEIVTMTGDGVNDAPALKEAHIGVAMGKNGTDVSRSVADLTLKDDNFITIIEAIREGRTIFNNIRKFVGYQLSCNYAELMVLFFGVLLAPYFGWAIPLLLALQILFMNLITDDFPAITLGFNKTSQTIMQEKPRKHAQILTRPLFVVTFISGFLMALLTLSSVYISFNMLNFPMEVARSVGLLTLILLEIMSAFNFRSFRHSVLARSPLVNQYLFYASLISLLAAIVIIYTPLNEIFDTRPLNLKAWIIASCHVLLFVLVYDIIKAFNRRFEFLKIT